MNTIELAHESCHVSRDILSGQCRVNKTGRLFSIGLVHAPTRNILKSEPNKYSVINTPVAIRRNIVANQPTEHFLSIPIVDKQMHLMRMGVYVRMFPNCVAALVQNFTEGVRVIDYGPRVILPESIQFQDSDCQCNKVVGVGRGN